MILPILPRLYNYSNNPINKQTPRTTRPELYQDTITFKGIGPKLNKQKVSLFTELLTESVANPNFFEKQKDFIGQILEEIMPSINSGMHKTENGTRGFVTRLDENFVIRAPHSLKNASRKIIHENCIQGTMQPNKFASVEDFYGHHIITFGNIATMKNATPSGTYTCIGRPYNTPWMQGGYEYYANQYLPTCAALPQESFDRLARNLKALNKIHDKQYYYEPDTINPNNFLIVDNHFRIIDDLCRTEVEQPNSITTMLEPLLTKISTSEYAVFLEELTAPRREIFGKILRASIKTDLTEPPSFSAERILEECYELAGLRHKAPAIRDALNRKDLAGIDEIFQNS